MTSQNDWTGKTAIITGGSSGIGKATALALTERGANVLITGRDQTRLDETAALSPKIATFQADSADTSNAQATVDAALNHWNRLDLLVNNAGAGHPLPTAAYDANAIANISAINVTAPSMLVHAAQSALRDSKGAIVNIGTAVSRNAAPMLAHYAATKAALEHLTQAWAFDMASDGIRVNAIAPGPVKTNALTGMMGLPAEMATQIEQQESSQIPMGRRGTTEDIVPWILRLGGADNAWLTGQILTIDGGWSLRS